jgi:hypothetical protein
MLVDATNNLIGTSKVIAKCRCGKESSTLYKCYKRSIAKRGYYLCFDCSVKTNSFRSQAAKNSKLAKRKTGPLSAETRLKLSSSIAKIYSTPEYKQKLSDRSKKLWSQETFRTKVSNKLKALWKDANIRQRAIDGINKHKEKYSLLLKEKWKNDPAWRAKCINITNPSSQQLILYSILDDLNIKYFPEYKVGFYQFDCMVPRGNRNLLIEVNGDYFHNKPEQTVRDNQKSTFISTYYNDKYELKTIWEHDFKSFETVKGLLLNWLSLERTANVDFDFGSVSIEKLSIDLAKIFFGKYHYTATAGRSGSFYCAKFNHKIVAACAFAVPTRKESANHLNTEPSNVRELTRFAIADGYHKKNFASWCLSKFVSIYLNDIPNVAAIITFADETYGHDGTIYKACNWKYLYEIDPDYFYIIDGKTMHKKTLWDHAQKLKKSEANYADEIGAVKSFGKKKHKFVCFRKQTSGSNIN